MKQHPVSVAIPALAAAALVANVAVRVASAQTWRPPSLPATTIGPLHVRRGGDGDPVVLLLHGLVASGDIFGAGFETLATNHAVVVPDLLGFGRSIDASLQAIGIEAHLDALDLVVDSLGIGDRPFVLGAHSMGSALAFAWAARHRNVRRIVCWGAPVHRDRAALDANLTQLGPMARLFGRDDRVAEAACLLSCRHRKAFGWLAVAAAPTLPVTIARMSSQHTWPAYRDALAILGETDWLDLASSLSAEGTEVDLVWGADDAVGDTQFARSLPGVRVTIIEGGHHLPLTNVDDCVAMLDDDHGRRLATPRPGGP